MGLGELIVIFILALIIFGPRQTISFASKLGRFIKKLKHAFDESIEELK